MKLSTIFPVLGILLFFYILFNIGIDKIGTTFLVIDPVFFLIALIFFLPRMILYSLKWQYLCFLQRMDIGLYQMMKIFLISLFYGSITPGGLGYYIRIYYLQEKCGSTLEKCLTNSLIDSATGFLGGLLLSLIGSLLIFHRFPGLFPIFLGASLVYLFLLIFFIKKERSNKIIQILLKLFIPERFKERIAHSFDLLYEDIPSPKIIPLLILFEFGFWILGATQVWIIAQSFSITVPFQIFILLSIIAATAGALPLSIGGLGIREGIFVLLLADYGVSSETAFVIALSGFLVKKLIPGLIGLPLSIKPNPTD